MIYDLIIVGSGPAGMSAALYAARQKLNFLLLTKNVGGMANYIPELKTLPAISYIHGYELVEKFKEQMETFKVPLCEDIEAKRIRRSANGNGFQIIANGSMYQTRTVIVASGRRFKRLEIKGEKEFEGKGLSFCAVCDGPIFKNKTVAIIGGGRSGLFSTLFMLKIAKKIYLIEKERNVKESGAVKEASAAVKQNPKVEIITSAQPVEIVGNKMVNGIKIKQKGQVKLLKVDGIFAEIGYTPNTEFLGDLVELNNRGEVIIDKNNMSDEPGIFAAGDATDLHEKQVIVAVGEGAKAALSALLYLEKVQQK